MELELRLAGADKIIEQLKTVAERTLQVGKAADEMQQKVDRAARATERMSRVSGPYSARDRVLEQINDARRNGASESQYRDMRLALDRSNARIARIENPVARPERDPFRNVSGPYTRRDRLRSQLDQAEASGAPESVRRDLRLSLGRAEDHIKRLQAPRGDMAERVANLLMSARFGAPGNLQPLVGRAMALGGVGTRDVAAFLRGPVGAAALRFAGPLMMAVGAAKEIYDHLEHAASEASRIRAEFSGTRFATGGSIRETAELKSLGITGEASRQLFDRIASNPVARSWAAQRGVNVVGGPYGDLNNAEKTLRLLKSLRSAPPDVQMRELREYGREDWEPLMRMSDDQFQKAMDDAQLDAMVLAPKYNRPAADFDASRQRLQRSVDRFGTAFGDRLLKPLADGINFVTDRLNALTDWADSSGQIDRFFDWAKLLLAPHVFAFDKANEVLNAHGIGNRSSSSGSAGAGERIQISPPPPVDFATSEHTRAMKANTEALVMLTKAWGDSQRASQAFPKALYGPDGRGDALLRASETGALRQGVL